MFQYSICAFLAPAVVSAMAFPWAGPEPTLTMPEMDNVSPAVTPAPKFGGMELFKRAGDNTCGYISGDSSRSLTCNNANYVCATNTYYSAHGCCDPDGISTCTLATTCIPSSSMSALCTGECSTNSYIAKCTVSSAPYCYQWLYVYGGGTVMTEHGCASSAFTQSVLRTSSGTPDKTTADITGGATTRPRSTSTETPSSTADSSSSSSTTGGSAASQSQTATSTPTETSSPKKTNIGAIVGGVVGGLVVIGAIAFGAIFLILRNRKNKKNPAATNGAQQPMMAQGPGPAPGVAEYKPQQPQNGAFPSPGQQYGAPLPASAGYYNHDQKPGFNQMGVPGQEMHPYSPPGSPAPQYPGPAMQPQHQMPVGIAEAGGSPVHQGQQPPQGHMPPPQQQQPPNNIYEAP